MSLSPSGWSLAHGGGVIDMTVIHTRPEPIYDHWSYLILSGTFVKVETGPIRMRDLWLNEQGQPNVLGVRIVSVISSIRLRCVTGRIGLASPVTEES